jgi:hypothetical protein
MELTFSLGLTVNKDKPVKYIMLDTSKLQDKVKRG